mmetsp:Transcript_6043/g.17073  ORF Transcript_6043/g.17073 Transcript_6043/m.17073 type:complete len:198 (+) Transcript_6043:1-594(+)
MDAKPLRAAKLVLLGDMGTGKSSLVLRFVKGQFTDYQESTIGAAFLTKSVPEHNIKFEIWDTAGQERYHSLAPMYYRGAAAAVVVYDITSPESFQRCQSWVRELQQQDNPGLVLAVAGNKADLEAQRQVSVDEGKAFAAQNGCLFLETSAKASTNVTELFLEIASRIPGQGAAQPQAPQGLVLADNQKGKGKKSQCC